MKIVRSSARRIKKTALKLVALLHDWQTKLRQKRRERMRFIGMTAKARL